MQTDHEYYIENWLKSVEDITIPSNLIPLEDTELAILVELNRILTNRYFEELKSIQKMPPEEQEDRVPLGWDNWLQRPQVAEITHRGDFKKLVHKIDQQFKPNQKYFGKLSLRSAKDSLCLKKKERKIEQTLTQKGFKNSR